VDRVRICGFATQGKGGNEEARLKSLLGRFETEIVPFDRQAKFRMFRQLLSLLRAGQYDLAVMEGSGVAGGLALILGRLLFGRRYAISSGDAIGPFLAARWPLFAPVFTSYEHLLYCLSDGFIGWTPYLVGRALTMGARRAMTAPGWAPFPISDQQKAEHRARIRGSLGIPDSAIVIGIAGALIWNARIKYCYGFELVRAFQQIKRLDAYALVVGDGSGLQILKAEAGQDYGRRIFLPGRVPQREVQVPAYFSAMDVASLPQSVDKVGSFRYTTKISEYLAAGLPVVTGQIPLAYDLDCGWLWRIPGSAPWDPIYLKALAELITAFSPSEISERSDAAIRAAPSFDEGQQVARVTAFISELLDTAT
jgi:hypothetical protein